MGNIYIYICNFPTWGILSRMPHMHSPTFHMARDLYSWHMCMQRAAASVLVVRPDLIGRSPGAHHLCGSIIICDGPQWQMLVKQVDAPSLMGHQVQEPHPLVCNHDPEAEPLPHLLHTAGAACWVEPVRPCHLRFCKHSLGSLCLWWCCHLLCLLLRITGAD